MEPISQLINELSDEDLLKEKAISSENFYILNLIQLFENRKLFNPNFFLYQYEISVIAFYEKIKHNSEYDVYTNQLRTYLLMEITEEVLSSIFSLIKTIQNEKFAKNTSKSYMVKRLE